MPKELANKELSVEEKVKMEMIEIYLDSILTGSSDNFYWVDKDSRVLGCNENQAKFFGFAKASDLIGKTMHEVAEVLGWDKRIADLVRANDLEVMQTGKAIRAEEVTKVDGQQKVYLSSKSPLRNKRGEIIGVFGVTVDITYQKQIEAALLEAKEKAEAASRAKSDFLAVVSHELRLPLTAILGMARLVQQDDEHLLPDHRGPIHDIINSGEHLLSLINDLLDFAKLEAGRVQLTIAPLDLKQLVEELITALNYQAEKKGIQLLLDYPHTLPHLINGDARAIKQIFINLVGNAIKFTEQGHVLLKINYVQPEPKKVILEFIVEDTGIGIANDKQQLIFDKFNQADNSRIRKYGGTGLGLAIVKDYVEIMGGSIEVKSTEGQGSCFICKIPFELQSVDIKESPWATYVNTVRILIVDDTLRGEVLKRHINSSLTEVVKSSEALNALRIAQLRREPFDIVIIDEQVSLPDCMQLSQSIQVQRKLQQPMLLLAAGRNSLLSKQAKSLGNFTAIISIPTYPTDLLTSLTATWEKWVERNRVALKVKPIFEERLLKILLVEDEVITQRVHTLMLERMGCEVDLAKTAQEALMKFKHGYDLVFMDIGLPDVDGFEITKQIRQLENNTGKYTPIIGLTGYGYIDDRNRCFLAGMDEMLMKPVKPEELREVLQQWLQAYHKVDK